MVSCSFFKKTTLIDYFVSKGIDLNSTDNNGNGIFNYASKKGNLEIMEKLIGLGALFMAPTKDGTNAMIIASRGTRRNINSLETFKYLESLGIPPNTTTKNGFTPLHALSFKNKDLSVFEYFIK
ncbi:MAG: ankyrin repeat domain-containing protein, partial [Flavobacteriaceae bacterium]|nr:ankyrin repeat domain-containing protein [Flavobacteriaceae bacterium]